MAFTAETLKGYMAGSGQAPGVWKHTSEDTFTDVTTAGYIGKDVVPVLNVGDFVFLTVNDSGGARMGRIAIVATKNIYDNGTPHEADLSDITTYAGDVRATDPAGFQLANFSGNIGAGASPRVFTYRNNTDSKATIAADGYFNELGEYGLKVNDLILTVANDGATILKVTGVGSTVTTQVFDLTPAP